jgi:hypothetical protein
MPTEIFQPHQRPTKMIKVDLLQLLAWTRELVENDDSMEGSITYGWSDEPGVYDVHAFLRTGNSMGQGGVVILQTTPEPEPAPDVDPAEVAFDAGMARRLAQSAAGETKDLGDFTQYDRPRYLCYITGEGTDAAIVNSIDEIKTFIEEQWAGQPLTVHPDEWESAVADLGSDVWDDGTGILRFDFETGYMTVERLGS